MRKLVVLLLFAVWLFAIAVAAAMATSAYGWKWWLNIDMLFLPKLWVLATVLLVATGHMFKNASWNYLPLAFAPLVGWFIYATTIDGKSMTNFFFLDGPMVVLICFGLFPALGFDGKKRKLLLPLVLLTEVVGIALIVKYLAAIGD